MLMREYIITVYNETEKTEYRITATEGWKAENKALAQHHGYITRVEVKRAEQALFLRAPRARTPRLRASGVFSLYHTFAYFVK